MENNDGSVTGGGVHILPKGVVRCEGIPRNSQMTKCVALQNDAGIVVGKGIFHNVDADLIIDSDNQPLGDDHVVVQIPKSLSEHNIPSNWLFQLRSWHISHVFVNGASLYDHEQMHLFNVASTTLRWQSWVDALLYESSKEQKNSHKIPKKEALLIVKSIRNVSTMSFCSKNCLQPFSGYKIEALRSEMHVKGSVYHRKHR